MTKKNYAFEFYEEDDFKSFFLVVYASYFNPVEVTLSNISVSSKEKPFSSEPFTPELKSKNKKKVLFIVIMVVCGVVFFALLIGLIIFIIIYQKKKKASITDDLIENIIHDDEIW